ncbi:MAG: hypothetical protein L0Z62_23240 [Gemmataceae bacterium]|nr:hypothetical protein [Gemmataceae bacterium]
MADWRKLAKTILLAGGHIDDRKVAILRKELFADKRIDQGELAFLFEAKRGAHKAVPAFQALLNEAIRTAILADGSISPTEVQWLRAYLLADAKVDEEEKKLLRELKLLADQVCPEFNALYTECMSK